MAISFTLPIYQRKIGGDLEWTTLVLGLEALSKTGPSALKIQMALTDALKNAIKEKKPIEMQALGMSRGMKLARVHLELTLKGGPGKRKMSGTFPLVLEPRWVSEEQRIVLAYHPHHQVDWFPQDESRPLEEQATIFFERAWAEWDDARIREMTTNGKDSIRSISFSAQSKTLLDTLPEREKGIWDDLYSREEKQKKKQSAFNVLPKIGTNETLRAIEHTLPLGIPREPYREQLQQLLLAGKKRSVIVVGPPGCGKSTLVARFIDDLLQNDDWSTHQNIDRVHDVWRIAGKRIIAGMSYVGDWEKRCVDLLEDTQKKRVILYVDDLYAFGRIGQTRQSERALADFFRGPVARGEVTIIGECTPEQLQRFEDDAPSFAALFSRVYVQPTTGAETLRMVVHEARELEQKYLVAFDAFAFRSVMELGGALFPGASFPGKALDLLRELAKSISLRHRERVMVTPIEVIGLLSQKTGLPKLLLQPERKLDPQELTRQLSMRVMGQPEAIEAAVDLVVRIRAGSVDPGRPYGVYLFTGPTGTGKTELASNIASYLYGDASRLLRFDMSELSGPDAPIRLIGDRFNPEGLLTQRVLDQPFSVVLLDEIEKAHPSVLNLLLQLFDEGRLTDAKGSTADFRHAVVIMTSNLGARPKPSIGFEENTEGVLFDIARAVRDFFPPELFNRIDRVVPFRPLTKEIAKKIADKAVAELVGRRGLVERNVFVYANEAVVDRIVREAFDPKDGARPVKRYVETKLGSLLTEEIVAADRASMQIFRILDANGAFRLHADRLVEAEQKPARYSLEPLFELETKQLKPHLERALKVVKTTLASDALSDAGEMLAEALQHGSYDHALYELDELKNRLHAHQEHIEALMLKRTDTDLDDVRDVLEGHRIDDRRATKSELLPPLKHELLKAIAEAEMLRRAAETITDADQHSVMIELLRVGRGKAQGRLRSEESSNTVGLLRALVDAYRSTKSELDAWALRTSGTDPKIHYAEGKPLPAISDEEQVVLSLSGVSIAAQLADEMGCHIGQSLISGTELIRVRVLPVRKETTPKKLIEEHLRARKKFETALESGVEELPPNPDALLPAVRILRFEPPERDGVSPIIEVEDYVLGYHLRTRPKNVAEVLERLWLIRMSATGEGGGA